MWLAREIQKLEKSVTDETLDSYCTTDELKIIGQNSTRLANLRNAIFEPQHNLLVMS